MKWLLVLFVFVAVLFSCKRQPNELDSSEEFTSVNSHQNFDWMVGRWLMTDSISETIEFWEANEFGMYNGFGLTKVGGDTVFYEELSLIKESEGWQLVVSGVHEAPMSFAIRESSSNSFVAFNPDNDFPKTIQYALTEKGLNALIYNQTDSLLFEFEKSD